MAKARRRRSLVQRFRNPVAVQATGFLKQSCTQSDGYSARCGSRVVTRLPHSCTGSSSASCLKASVYRFRSHCAFMPLLYCSLRDQKLPILPDASRRLPRLPIPTDCGTTRRRCRERVNAGDQQHIAAPLPSPSPPPRPVAEDCLPSRQRLRRVAAGPKEWITTTRHRGCEGHIEAVTMRDLVGRCGISS